MGGKRVPGVENPSHPRRDGGDRRFRHRRCVTGETEEVGAFA
jgi:hypothetical protein